jgi:anti-sigma B factor antagonist
MSLARSAAGRRVVLRVEGEVDMATAPELERAAQAAAADAGVDEVWLDLSGTEFIDCAGLHALEHLEARFSQLGLRLTVVCGRGEVRRTIELLGLEQRLELRRIPPDMDGSAR